MNIPNGYYEDTLEYPDLGNGYTVLINYSGGLQISREGENKCRISPVLKDKKILRSGLISETAAATCLSHSGAIPLQIERLSAHGPVASASQVPIVPGRTNHLRSPADYWSNSARNLEEKDSQATAHSAASQPLSGLEGSSHEVAAMRRLSGSLANADLSMSLLISAHSEALFRSLQSGESGMVRYPAIESAFSNHALSFFTALGAARDHFACLLGQRLGLSSNIDDMTKLLKNLEDSEQDDPIVALMFSDGILANNDGKVQSAGWLDELRKIRRQYVHRTPYGFGRDEGFGVVEETSSYTGLWRYRRCYTIGDMTSDDLLFSFGTLYRKACSFFLRANEISEYDDQILTLTEADIVSFDIRGKP